MNEEILFDDEKAAAHGRRDKQSSDAERIRWRHRLPAVVVRRAEDSGERGIRWLDELDGVVAALESLWRIKVGAVLSGGTHGLAADAVGWDGERYVLKIDIPGDPEDDEFFRSIRVFSAAGGRGYARLIACDEKRQACLLERLGAPLSKLGLPLEEQLAIICRTLEETWRIPAAGMKLPTGADSVQWFRTFLAAENQRLGRPCGTAVLDQASAFLASREQRLDPSGYVLVHGDAHAANTLEDRTRTGCFKFIDPDGLVYEKAYDLGVLMREWTEAYQPDPLARGLERCRYLHRLTGVNQRGIWEWGFLQCVSTGLVLWMADRPAAQRLLSVAQAWCGATAEP